MGAILRTSALPKLAECPSYTGAAGDPGPYAARGTICDVAFRLEAEGVKWPAQCACGSYFEKCDCGPEDEVQGPESALDDLDERIENHAKEHGIKNKPAREGVEWAISKMRELAGEGVRCITDESQLTVEIEGLDADGTADGNAPSVLQGFDLKTGKISNYMEQMAGYALGFMDLYFADKYTMHLLFMDEKTVITHKFTHEEASRIVSGIRESVLDPNKKQRPNPYCDWCAYSTSCSTRRDLAQDALEFAGNLNVREGLGEIARNPARLGDFLLACNTLKSFESVANNHARSRLTDDQPVKGWTLTEVIGIPKVTPQSAIRHTKKLPKGEELTLEKLFLALGDLTPFQFKNIMKAVNKPLPKKYTKQGRRSTYLMRLPEKKK